MVTLNSKEKLKQPQLIGSPISRGMFNAGRSEYEKRIQDNDNKHGVIMNEDAFVKYFTVETFYEIFSQGQHIVARFGSEGADANYKALTAGLCAMNAGIIDNTTPIYIGTDRVKTTSGINESFSLNIQVTDLWYITNWRTKESNYRARRDNLVRGNSIEFKNDYVHGVAHEIKKMRYEWFDNAVKNGMKNVAAYFIKIDGHLSVAYTNANVELWGLDDEFVGYDFGQGCCPPQ